MKLMRIGSPGLERPALLAGDGSIRDLSAVIDAIAGPALSASVIGTVAGIDGSALPVADPSTRVGPCVASSRNFVCIGANYSDAVAEPGKAPPAEPVLFQQ